MALTAIGRKIIGAAGRETVGRNVSEQRNCPECGCALDRPHALICSRCMAEIPWASGCSGCGKCQRRG
jgi:hypothetical protein